MASFPDFLYKLTPRDEQITGVEIFNRLDEGAAAAVTVATTLSYEVPGDRVLILNGITYSVQAGAAQKPITARLLIQPPKGGVQYYIGALTFDQSIAAGAVENGISTAGAWYIAPGSLIEDYFVFSAGANVNNAATSLQGLLIPRGTIAI